MAEKKVIISVAALGFLTMASLTPYLQQLNTQCKNALSVVLDRIAELA